MITPYTTGLFLAPNVHSVPEKVVPRTEYHKR